MSDEAIDTLQDSLERIRTKSAFICDMDGVLYHGNRLLDGADRFITWLQRENKRFLFLTNSSERSPKELHQKLARMGVDVGPEHFYTSALATASFLASQKPEGSAYVIGEAGLINALYEVGYAMNDINPDYVVVGESRNYNTETLFHAVSLVRGGARLIGTNPDLTGPTERGIAPATGALITPIALAAEAEPYFIGKPNPLMMRSALKRLESRREETVIIGDRMDTDIKSGLESEIETVLVLSGVTDLSRAESFAYRPHHILEGVGAIAS
ncbi:HAD-IIA family hydrolase [Sediminispirochaeta smaragdinae]|uniref:HAD-superfamily hydrolase, subfamily IIA n=1 Tax=Sediminispirochaeta smaragdinae (strain DSM 11293 / JCM 15392 / SEBR 4228) TaxID=573413 RepID=E1R5K3_SEDSS|nr:HAD-IIA family hydrolase [Sediminispirochaeta smaragdinae]ADK82331.1 HAD-superfamily hydrolase, subfamily IIA [Sediminispirochaeta smaragdinae DSM 11293]